MFEYTRSESVRCYQKNPSRLLSRITGGDRSKWALQKKWYLNLSFCGSTQTELNVMDLVGVNYSLRVFSLSMIMIFWYGVRTERQHNNTKSRNITMNEIVRNNISNLFFVFCFTLWGQGKSKEKKYFTFPQIDFLGVKNMSILAQSRSFCAYITMKGQLCWGNILFMVIPISNILISS